MDNHVLNSHASAIKSILKHFAFLLVVIIFCTYILCGCSIISPVDVSGKYEYAAWTVMINEDSSYHVFVTKTNETIRDGVWSYDNSNSMLKFENFTDEGEDIYFVRNGNSFILFSMDEGKPYYYDELLVEDDGSLNFTYEFKSLDLRFCANGDIIVSGDNFEYGDGTYEIKENKVYAYYTYTRSSARNDAHGEMYFYIYDGNHVTPYNYIMIKE